MSKIKEYIDDMMENGIDVLSNENIDSDYEYLKSLEDMNRLFDEESETTEKSE